MASQTRIFVADLGMKTLSFAEFRTNALEGLVLHFFAQEELSMDASENTFRLEQLKIALRTLRVKAKIQKGEKLHVSLPSQAAFIRFVKLPGAQPEDVRAMMGFETQQNIPFPINEVTWDYQLIGPQVEGSWDVVLIATKSNLLDAMNKAVKEAGFLVESTDIAPIALYNAFRFNYAEEKGCLLIINIGACSTNLIFTEGEKVFIRSIPIGSSTFSTAIAKELGKEITIAERIKCQWGFVISERASAELKTPDEIQVSQLIRSLLTRLHGEIARSIVFYRSNQGGAPPARILLCGGAVDMSYMREFFNEKLQTEVDFFHPLRNVLIQSEEIAKAVNSKLHILGEVVGLATRAFKNIPIEIHLLSPKGVREQTLSRCTPFLVGASVCLILAFVTGWFYLLRATDIKTMALNQIENRVAVLQSCREQIQKLRSEQAQREAAILPFLRALEERAFWPNLINTLEASLPSRFIWITRLEPIAANKTLLFASPSSNHTMGSRDILNPSQGIQMMRERIDKLLVEGLYLENPQQATVIDEFVNRLSQSSLFVINDKAKVVPMREPPDGEHWAYRYALMLPLRGSDGMK